jgi:hypothetical protein
VSIARGASGVKNGAPGRAEFVCHRTLFADLAGFRMAAGQETVGQRASGARATSGAPPSPETFRSRPRHLFGHMRRVFGRLREGTRGSPRRRVRLFSDRSTVKMCSGFPAG